MPAGPRLVLGCNMRTVREVLEYFGACERAKSKYDPNDRAFKKAFVEAHWSDAGWFGCWAFLWQSSAKYPELPRDSCGCVCPERTRELFRKKANRIKYWPVVKRRLIAAGVKL